MTPRLSSARDGSCRYSLLTYATPRGLPLYRYQPRSGTFHLVLASRLLSYCGHRSRGIFARTTTPEQAAVHITRGSVL